MTPSRAWLAATALSMMATASQAAAYDGPHAEYNGPQIEMSVEQPAFTGMPIWVDVTVHDACLNTIYAGDFAAAQNGSGPFHAHPEITPYPGSPEAGPGMSGYLAPSPLVPPPPQHRYPGFNSGELPHHPCPEVYDNKPDLPQRFPLHIAAAFPSPRHLPAPLGNPRPRPRSAMGAICLGEIHRATGHAAAARSVAAIDAHPCSAWRGPILLQIPANPARRRR